MELIIGQIIGGAIGSLIGAVLLRAAAHWIIKEDVSYGKAYVTVFFSTLANLVIGFVVGFAMGSSSQSEGTIAFATFLMLPIGFFVQAGIIAFTLMIDFGKACLISLTMIGLALGIAAVVGGLVFGFMQVIN